MNKHNLTAKDREALHTMLEYLREGQPVLVSGGLDGHGVPGTNQVGPGRVVNTPRRCEHIGWGTFECGDFSYSKADYRADNFSFSLLAGPVDTIYYPFADAIAGIEELLR